jgi:hypothetical protein
MRGHAKRLRLPPAAAHVTAVGEIRPMPLPTDAVTLSPADCATLNAAVADLRVWHARRTEGSGGISLGEVRGAPGA